MAIGGVAAALVLPQLFSDAAATAVSTIATTGTNPANGSTSASDATGGPKPGSAKPGDTIDWATSYKNNTAATATVDLKDTISAAGTYVAGSLTLPPLQNPLGSIAPQYTTGSTWVAGTPPANATGIGFTATDIPQGTHQLSPGFSAPSSIELNLSGGDAYNAVVRNRLVYAVYHHSTGAVVYCGQADGKTCPGWPTNSNVQPWSATVGAAIGTGVSFAGKTSVQAAAFVFNNKLYWYAGVTDNSSAGLACLDLSTTTPKSCGYWARTGNVSDNNTRAAQINGTGVTASNGYTYSVAVHVGQAALLCTTPNMDVCGGAYLYTSGVNTPAAFTSAAFGAYVFASVQQTQSSSWQTFCWDTTRTALCTGSWPKTTAPATFPLGPLWIGNTYAPVLSTAGALTGVCTITYAEGTSSACWNLSGTALASNPYAGTGANYIAGGIGTGDPYIIGTKVYLSNGNEVMCRDFKTYTGTGTVPACTGFTNVMNKSNYTVRDASDNGLVPGCLIASGDGSQITLFDATTGKACTAPSAPQSVTAKPASYYCAAGASGFTGWDVLSIVGAAPNSYSTWTVTLRDQNNSIISSFNNVTFTSSQAANLKGIATTVTSITATVTLNGVSNAAGVATAQIRLTWQGAPVQMCFKTKAPAVACDAATPLTLSNSAVVVTTSTGASDSPGGNSSGAASFAVQADASQCGLKISKTSPQQQARPGDTIAYTITVLNTGTQAYVGAAFTDDLTEVLKDATFTGNQKATVGTVSYAAPILSWSGSLAPAATATITYSVTVKSPDTGPHSLRNTVVSSTRGSNCAKGSSDPLCTVVVSVTVTDVLWHKVDATAAKNILAGAEWTLTPVNASGTPTGPAIVVTDCVAESASSCPSADIDPVGGLFRVTNLGPGTYRLVETRAPVGFKVDPTPITVTVAQAATTVSLADVVNNQLPVPTLPFTGGLGSDTLTITGGGLLAVMIGLASWHLIRRRRTA
ncbi:SpaA isopeptide-forming pilin-related protein [Leifsonia sp. SIMBA_070]|uniref:DUF7927 domain-containing protein n=1 Tax=Leifsonia sp. SIMBA_070 TaxID=3085810 RepID=UPI00397A74D7